MRFYSDDPVRDAERYDEYLEGRRERHCRGECIHCGEAVYDYDDHYDIEGDVLHQECLTGWAEQYRRGV